MVTDATTIPPSTVTHNPVRSVADAGIIITFRPKLRKMPFVEMAKHRARRDDHQRNEKFISSLFDGYTIEPMNTHLLEYLSIILQFLSFWLVAPEIIGADRIDAFRQVYAKKWAQKRIDDFMDESKNAESTKRIQRVVLVQSIAAGILTGGTAIVGFAALGDLYRFFAEHNIQVCGLLLILLLLYLLWALYLLILNVLTTGPWMILEWVTRKLMFTPVRRTTLLMGIVFFILSTVIQLVLVGRN
ncbi:MAG: hypothetical protein IT320_20145 [Anaerolineae bacterium]|nr:hypothetical protein [Anaerolineae bacterium]